MKFDLKIKRRCFNFDVYPESQDLQAILDELDKDFIPYAYIIHDKDNKKTHVHFMIDYGQPTTLKFIISCYGHLAANGYIEPTLLPDRYYLYMYHDPSLKRSQGKYNYCETAVHCCNGFDPAEIKCLTETEKTLYFDEIMRIANELKIYELAGMYEYLSQNNRELYKFAMNNTILLRGYMDSHRNRNKKVNNNNN